MRTRCRLVAESTVSQSTPCPRSVVLWHDSWPLDILAQMVVALLSVPLADSSGRRAVVFTGGWRAGQ